MSVAVKLQFLFDNVLFERQDIKKIKLLYGQEINYLSCPTNHGQHSKNNDTYVPICITLNIRIIHLEIAI